MPTNSKHYRLSAIVTAITFSALLPLSTLAETEKPNRPEGITKASTTRPAINFCARLENAFGKLQQRAQEKRNKLTEKKDGRVEHFKTKRAEKDEKLATHRETADERRDNRYQGLEERAQTDAQKTAVAKFKTDVETAVKVRKAGVDAAIKTFREGVDAAAKTRLDAVKKAGDDFKTAVDAAVAKAKADCALNSDPGQVKQAFQASIQAAQEAFAGTRKDLEKLQPQLEALKKTRNEAVKKAIQDFKAALEKAKAELKIAFPQTENETNT